MRNAFLVSLLVIPFLVGCPKGGDLPSPAPGPGPVPTPLVAPSAEMQEIVRGVVPFSDSEIAGFYGDFADLLLRDADLVKSTSQFREAYVRAGKIMWQRSGKQGKYPGLADQIDLALERAVGKENKALDYSTKGRLVDTLKAVEWALQ